MKVTMKKALISSIEPVQSGHRVAQVEPIENTFAVAEGLFWVDCADDVIADRFWYDPLDQTIKPVPLPAPDAETETQPTGTQSF